MVVIDASAALSWLLADERDGAAVAMLETLVEAGGFAPALWRWEVQNALLLAERRKRIGSEDVRLMLEEIEGLRLEIDGRADLEMGIELTLARRFSITAYDAAYLELAIRKNLKLMTRDAKLADAAAQMGLLWQP